MKKYLLALAILFVAATSFAGKVTSKSLVTCNGKYVYIKMEREAGLAWIRSVESEMQRRTTKMITLAIPVEK